MSKKLRDAELDAIVGSSSEPDDFQILKKPNKEFKPWHQPVKQIARSGQWVRQTKRLAKSLKPKPDDPDGFGVLRYFTLPGDDFFDVKLLIDFCKEIKVKVEYFGFNNADNAKTEIQPDESIFENDLEQASFVQADYITANSIILGDDFEDIAEKNTQASVAFASQNPFDVVNLDLCGYLVDPEAIHHPCAFDALQKILNLQVKAERPWLLFLTTRIGPNHLGKSSNLFRTAIQNNIDIQNSGFGPALAECLGVTEAELESAMEDAWNHHTTKFAQIYSIGLGKHLLQFYFAQRSFRAKVELISVYSYRVDNVNPDMLSFAFRITPTPFQIQQPATQIAPEHLEVSHALKVVERVKIIKDLDFEIRTMEMVRSEAIAETEALLTRCGYDIPKWREWWIKQKRHLASEIV